MRILTASLFLLAGCSTVPGPVQVRTVEIRTPVAISCVQTSQIPTAPPKVGSQLNGDAQHDLDVVAASAIRLRAALDVTLSLLGACAG
jgi:starvation-inducible outer membrane lipoprotein